MITKSTETWRANCKDGLTSDWSVCESTFDGVDRELLLAQLRDHHLGSFRVVSPNQGTHYCRYFHVNRPDGREEELTYSDGRLTVIAMLAGAAGFDPHKGEGD